MSENELDHLGSSMLQDLHYFPQIKFFNKNNKIRPIDYDRGLEIEDLLQFIKRFSKVQIVEEPSNKKEQLNENEQRKEAGRKITIDEL